MPIDAFLTAVGIDPLQAFDEWLQFFAGSRFVNALFACRPFAEVGRSLVFPRGTDRPELEPSATIRTDVFKDALDAIGAEGALERTDHRQAGIGRQIAIALFTGWS